MENKSKDIVESITTIDASEMLKEAKLAYSKRYSEQMVQLIEDNARLERALKFVREHIKKVAEGDVFAIEDYMKSRQELTS